MAKRSSGLGRGLDAIFLDNTIVENTQDKENTISLLKISLVDPKSDQPRKYFDKAALEEQMRRGAEEASYYARRTLGKVQKKLGFVKI